MSDIDKSYEDFLKSLQEDNGGAQESFPFNEDFDIETFIKTTETPAREPIQAANPQIHNDVIHTTHTKPLSPTAEQINHAKEKGIFLSNGDGQQINFETAENKNYSIKRLEEKLSDLQQKFDEANVSKAEESVFAAELNKTDKDDFKTEPVKSDEEFFSNISSAIQTLKGSLDSIVSTRLQYEENLIRQDQTLIARLKEKTTRLKAINLALNSEVKRSRSEKLEYLRRSAEQTKELLSLRMQLSHAEERTKQGDFKVSGLEQQITLLEQEKSLLDEEISKIRQEKLTYLQNSTEQTRNIMQLRHQLATKEEALKQEEVKTNFLEQQLKSVEAEHSVLQREKQNSDIEKSEAQKTLLLQREEINSLRNKLAQSKNELLQKSQEAANLREQLLNLQLSPERTKNDMAAFTIKQEEILTPLKISQQEHEQKIDFLRAEQSAELQRLRKQALQEENILREELQKTERKYYQEGGLVQSLKMQISALENNLKALEQENADYKNKSDNLTKELDSIKESSRAELLNLREKLQKAQNSFDRQQELYNNLETQYKDAQREKYYLSEEIKKTIIQRDNALLQNESYLSEIEKIKNSQNNLTNELRKEIQEILASKNQLAQNLDTLKNNSQTPNEQIQQAENYLQEKNNNLEILKSQMASLLSSKENIDKALLEAKQEKLQLISKLEEQTKKLNTFQNNYQKEISALSEEKIRAQLEAETRIKNLQEKITADQKIIDSLNKKLEESKSNHQAITEEKSSIESLKINELEQELEKANKVFNQDTVLLGELKSQYSKLQERNEILEQELVKAKEENKRIEQEVQDYKIQVEDLSKQLNDIREELRQGQEFTKKLSSQVTKLKMVNVALNAALKQMQEQKIEALNVTVQQTKEILELREQLKRIQTDAKSLNFENGTVTVSADHSSKIHSLEEELKRISEVCMTQVKEINKIKTDNAHLKTVAEEKVLLQNRFNALQRHFNLMSEELKVYEENDKSDALIKAKASALAAQLQRIDEEKNNLKQQLQITQVQLKEATERERKASQELETLRKNLSKNEDSIFKLREEIIPLAEETRSNIGDIVNVKNEDKQKLSSEALVKGRFDGDNFEIDLANNEDNKDEEEDPLSFLESTKPVQNVEEVYLPEQESDLASIFEDDEEDNWETSQKDNGIVVEEVKPTDISQIIYTTDASVEDIKKDLNIVPDEDAYTDHSIRRSVISRHRHIRNPITSSGKDEEYSDFLKKTKSLFYRIKWSLFKD